MTKAENDYQYTLHNRIIDLEAENRRLNFIIEDYNQQFSLQGVSHRRELLIATLYGWQDYKDQGISIEDYVEEIESNL